MTFEIIFVLLALLGMVVALALDKMRPGMVLFSVVVLFLCAGPKRCWKVLVIKE